MSEDEFIKLYEKFKSGKCTSREIELLENFQDGLELRERTWTQQMGVKAEIHEALRSRLQQSIHPVAETFNWLPLMRWTAAALIAMVCGLFLFNQNTKTALEENAASTKLKFETKSGEKKQIVLQDGTKIWLNSASVLTLAKNFNEKTREVNLIGEAYFDVSHKKDRPFKVHTSDFDINVLGTAFNIKAYPDDQTSEATLIRGSISMESMKSVDGTITLKPKQKITFIHEHPTLKNKRLEKVPKVLINQYKQLQDTVILETAWTANRLEIADQNFKELQNVLERWFDVKLVFKSKVVESYRFTATIKDEDITTVLKSLQKAQYFNYEMKENTILISK